MKPLIYDKLPVKRVVGSLAEALKKKTSGEVTTGVRKVCGRGRERRKYWESDN